MTIPRDKLLHFSVGFAIFALSRIVFSTWIALLIVTIVGIGKEVYDYFHRDKHTPELLDFIATVAGGITGIIIQCSIN